MSTISIAQALSATQALGLERLDAQLLLLHVLGRPPGERAWLLAHDDYRLPPASQQALLALASRRAAGEPLAYLTGHKEFFGLDLQVDGRVLVPRPDTETLVDWALQVLAPYAEGSVLDLGCGSGAIALALKASRPALRVSALDASSDALAVAQANAQRLRLGVIFSQGDWLSTTSGWFDAIVSNHRILPTATATCRRCAMNRSKHLPPEKTAWMPCEKSSSKRPGM